MNILFMTAQTSGWSSMFTGIEPGEQFVLLTVAMGCAVGVILGLAGIVSNAIGSIQHRRAEMDLKREMIERGMSADEITKIIEAAAPPEGARQRWIASWAKKKT